MKRPRRHLALAQKRGIAGWCFIAPFVLGLAMIFIPSLILAVSFSFNAITINPTGYTLEFVGWDYYRTALAENAWYVRNLTETFTDMLTNVPLILAFSFIMSGILNQNFLGRGLARVILFLPVIIMSGIIVKMDTASLNGLTGFGGTAGTVNEAVRALDIQRLLLRMNVAPDIIETISKAVANLYTVINTSGVQILIFLAALQTIPSSLYEASTVEGASGWESFWKITFPMLTPYILANVVYTVVDSLASYNTPVMQVIMETAQASYGDLSLSIAMSFIFFVMVAAILAVVSFLVSRMVFYYE